MIDRFSLLLMTLFGIISAFFIGLYFGKEITIQEIKNNGDGQISIRTHGNTIEIERIHSPVRVLLNEKPITNSGSFTIPK